MTILKLILMMSKQPQFNEVTDLFHRPVLRPHPTSPEHLCADGDGAALVRLLEEL